MALLITGASGQLAGLVLERLIEQQLNSPLIATSRTLEPLQPYALKGVEVRHADFDDPATLPVAFAGAERLLLISTDAIAVPGQRQQQHRNAIDAAVQAGVRHIVYTSFFKSTESDLPIAPDHVATEAMLDASGIGYTVLRNAMYMDMALGTVKAAIANGQMASAQQGQGMNYVTREDCAAVAAAALTDGFEGKRILEVTGPAAVTSEALAALAGEIAGKPVAHVPVTVEQLKEGMLAAGLPAPMVGMMAAVDEAIAAGTLKEVTTSVEDMTGQPATTIEDFLNANRDALLAS
jgi:NAD(P)H dehydrogenase (quinone)